MGQAKASNDYARSEMLRLVDWCTEMAEVHQRMAVCLKSDRPMTECRADVRKNCRDLMGTDHCPIMGWLPRPPAVPSPPS
jgi:hypothetical protein